MSIAAVQASDTEGWVMSVELQLVTVKTQWSQSPLHQTKMFFVQLSLNDNNTWEIHCHKEYTIFQLTIRMQQHTHTDRYSSQ